VILLRPVPRAIARSVTLLILVGWLAQMAFLIKRSYIDPAVLLAADLARYGSNAQWKAVYYRGEKIGFLVGQTASLPDGYELREDGRLQMLLLGASTVTQIKTLARVDHSFRLRSFEFSLDPGTGAIAVSGVVEGRRLRLNVTSPGGGVRSEVRELPEAPILALNLPRRLAAEGLESGRRIELMAFDPATLRNAPMTVEVKGREVVPAAGRPVPAFRVETGFAGITSTSWVTDLGEVVREESPLGLLVVKETPNRATLMATTGTVHEDLLTAVAVVPRPSKRIDDPQAVELLRVRLELPGLDRRDLDGVGQTVVGDVFDLREVDPASPGPRDPGASAFLVPEPFLESDAPEVREEARKATSGLAGPRARAERLVRHVNAILEKKPTVGLPSAREVLRTRVGDCNEHTALYVALARSLGIPARIAVGLVHLRGAFYYHAWAEAWVEVTPGRGLWIPADPTLNQFPADPTHIRLARGGLDRQAAILPVIGRAKMAILELKLRPGTSPVLVGRPVEQIRPLDIPLPRRGGGLRGCWSTPED
jgi:hypothetical protein